MVKTKKQMFIIIGIFALVLFLGGTAYAWFNYSKTTGDQMLITGDIYLHLNEGNDQISMTNIFPETALEARARDDNYITFNVSGLNTSNKTIYYEFLLNHGEEKESPKTRYRDEDLRFDLVELDSNGNEIDYLLNDVSYDTLVNKRIWVDTVDASTSTEVVKRYKLRMWLADTVIISDSDPNATYTTAEYKNKYATIKLTVHGDFMKKELYSAVGIISQNVNTTKLIDFSQISSSTNGEGVYILPGTEYDENPIYYYRGAVNNNNVIFGDLCWQVVRTTDTGGVKMIYNGIPTITGSGNNISYNCGITRPIQNNVLSIVALSSWDILCFSDAYEIVSTSGNAAEYKLKPGTHGIQSIAITTENAESVIPTIAENYPYTCIKPNADATCTTLYKVDSYFEEKYVYAYVSTHLSNIATSEFNPGRSENSVYGFNQSMADIGFSYNERYETVRGSAKSGSIYGKNVEWNGTKYLVIEDTPGVASTNKSLNATHHYTCGKAATTLCDTVWYYYSGNEYIVLKNGDNIEDALYKMTGNGTDAVKEKNSSYVLNANDSTIKSVLENWFKTNLTNEVDNTKMNYVDYLEDTIFCDNRSFRSNGSYGTYEKSGWNPNNGSLSVSLQFDIFNRTSNNNWYSTTNAPSLVCQNETDQFMVNNNKAKLDYPVGFLTADEVILAGASGNSTYTNNRNYYLYTAGSYWTMTPTMGQGVGASGEGANVMSVLHNGGMQPANVVATDGARPVISLKPGIKFENRGNGTPTNPYVVKYN